MEQLIFHIITELNSVNIVIEQLTVYILMEQLSAYIFLWTSNKVIIF